MESYLAEQSFREYVSHISHESPVPEKVDVAFLPAVALDVLENGTAECAFVCDVVPISFDEILRDHESRLLSTDADAVQSVIAFTISQQPSLCPRSISALDWGRI